MFLQLLLVQLQVLGDFPLFFRVLLLLLTQMMQQLQEVMLVLLILHQLMVSIPNVLKWEYLLYPQAHKLKQSQQEFKILLQLISNSIV